MDSGKTEPAGDAPLRALLDADRDAPIALLHSCGQGGARLFASPVDVLTLESTDVGTAFDRLGRFLGEHSERPCVGYLGYDLRDAVEPLGRSIEEDLAVPLLHVVAHERVEEWSTTTVPVDPGSDAAPGARGVRARTTRRDYERRIERVVEHIRAGDIFQANLTQPFTGRFDGDPRQLFWRLCARSPAPFAAYLETGTGVHVLSSSPEEFLSVAEDGVARTLPIKGTRPRGADADRDAALLAELLASEKDRAELAMIVDLMRNDLGKVAVAGSVEVGPFPEHASYAQVHHLFARVTARLAAGTSAVDLLRATFPPGSVTGAPKLRCMEIIEDLELVRRGVYTGAIGWFGPGPALHLNVAIRTMVVAGGRLRFNTGGGITADSVPAVEYDETLHKAAGMLRALDCVLETP